MSNFLNVPHKITFEKDLRSESAIVEKETIYCKPNNILYIPYYFA